MAKILGTSKSEPKFTQTNKTTNTTAKKQPPLQTKTGDVQSTKQTIEQNQSETGTTEVNQFSQTSELLQQQLEEKFIEPKTIEQLVSSPPEFYLNLSHEDYLQHKSPILQCKFSNDGKYVASVDAQAVIKSKNKIKRLLHISLITSKNK